jgi:hypothetical protein
LNRFKHNNFTVEKNPTIVMFPVKNFDLSEYVFRDDKEKVPTVDEVKGMSVSLWIVLCNNICMMQTSYLSIPFRIHCRLRN